MQDENKESKAPSVSNLEDADTALYDWISNTLDISVETSDGFKEVPVRWVAGEKSYQAKNSPDFRDSAGALILPLITLERTSVGKDPAKRGALAVLHDSKEGPDILRVKRKVKQDKTDNFSSAYAKRKYGKLNFKTQKPTKVVYEESFIPYPVIVEATYKISLRAEYQQQMNDMIHSFITFPGGLNYTLIKRGGISYEVFFGSEYSMSNTVSDMEAERKFETEIEARVMVPLFGDEKNEKMQKIKTRETVVEVKISREKVILDPNEIR